MLYPFYDAKVQLFFLADVHVCAVLENHPPSPSLPLKKGLHRFPLNPLSPQGTGDLTGKPAVLYSQASSRPFGVARGFLRNRVAIVYALWARLRNVGFYIEMEALFTWGVDRASTWGVDRASTWGVDRVVTLLVDRAGTL